VLFQQIVTLAALFRNRYEGSVCNLMSDRIPHSTWLEAQC
jgi:hypothetical protein